VINTSVPVKQVGDEIKASQRKMQHVARAERLSQIRLNEYRKILEQRESRMRRAQEMGTCNNLAVNESINDHIHDELHSEQESNKECQLRRIEELYCNTADKHTELCSRIANLTQKRRHLLPQEIQNLISQRPKYRQ